MKKALEAVRARRAGQATLQPKPEQKAAPTLPAMDGLEDILEDEEAMAPPQPTVKRQGFGPQVTGEPCPPMQSLVQRRTAKVAKLDGEEPKPTRRNSVQDGVF